MISTVINSVVERSRVPERRLTRYGFLCMCFLIKYENCSLLMYKLITSTRVVESLGSRRAVVVGRGARSRGYGIRYR
jgi:hypothetical protein